MKEPLSAPHFYIFMSKKKKQNKTTIKKNKNKIYVKRYIENSKGQSKQKESQKKESVRKYKRLIETPKRRSTQKESKKSAREPARLRT